MSRAKYPLGLGIITGAVGLGALAYAAVKKDELMKNEKGKIVFPVLVATSSLVAVFGIVVTVSTAVAMAKNRRRGSVYPAYEMR